jgi:Spy/CpxP family protein refolding chaperone
MKRILLTLVVSSLALMAQPRARSTPGTPRTPDELKAFLGLSDSQVQSLTQLRQQQNEALRTKSQDMRTKHEALRNLLNSNTADAAAVGRLMLDIEATRKSVRTEAERFRTQAVAVLNDAQKAKLKTLEDAVQLQPAIRQAGALGLLTPPEGGERGQGRGPMMMRGNDRGRFGPGGFTPQQFAPRGR